MWSGDCDTLSCVAGDDDGCTDLRSTVTFSSSVGTTYSIFVYGYDGAVGNYELSLVNTFGMEQGCSSAAVIIAGQTIVGSTVGAQRYASEECFNAVAISAPGAWYKFEGTGAQYQATLCVAENILDPQVCSLWCGLPCFFLMC